MKKFKKGEPVLVTHVMSLGFDESVLGKILIVEKHEFNEVHCAGHSYWLYPKQLSRVKNLTKLERVIYGIAE